MMNRYALKESLQQLDAQYGAWVALVKSCGADHPRTREQLAYYRGKREGLRTALSFDRVEVCEAGAKDFEKLRQLCEGQGVEIERR